MRASAVKQQDQIGLVQSTLLVVLSAETVLFGTLVMSYLFLRSGGSETHFSHPKSTDIVIAGLNTLILLASAAFVRSALQAVTQDHLERLKAHLMSGLVLGAVFVAGQIFEFNHSGMQIDDSAFGGVFFALIGFHALHVLAGMIILGLNAVRARLGDFSARRHVAVTAGAWFWYYVTAVWLMLFTVLYLV